MSRARALLDLHRNGLSQERRGPERSPPPDKQAPADAVDAPGLGSGGPEPGWRARPLQTDEAVLRACAALHPGGAMPGPGLPRCSPPADEGPAMRAFDALPSGSSGPERGAPGTPGRASEEALLRAIAALRLAVPEDAGGSAVPAEPVLASATGALQPASAAPGEPALALAAAAVQPAAAAPALQLPGPGASAAAPARAAPRSAPDAASAAGLQPAEDAAASAPEERETRVARTVAAAGGHHGTAGRGPPAESAVAGLDDVLAGLREMIGVLPL